MHESNRGPESLVPDPPVPGVADIAFGLPPAPDPEIAARHASVLRGLRRWFILIALLGVLALIANMVELTLFIALATVFVAAGAADRDERFVTLSRVMSGLMVAGAAASFGFLGYYLANAPSVSWPGVGVALAAVGAVASLVTALPSAGHVLATWFFRTHATSHTSRLAARLVLMVLLFTVPGWLAMPPLLRSLERAAQPLLEPSSTVSTLLGMVVLAFGAVGFWIRRDAPATLDRLGLEPLRLSHVVVAIAGVAALFVLNMGTEQLQHRWFPDQWAHDQRINDMLAGGITMSATILVGVGAGIGEELTMRGALQPRLGLVLTSLLFAALHVHYSWFGMAMIFVLGLALGAIRKWTSTTVSILVHTIYDIAAVLAAVGVPKH